MYVQYAINVSCNTEPLYRSNKFKLLSKGPTILNRTKKLSTKLQVNWLVNGTKENAASEEPYGRAFLYFIKLYLKGAFMNRKGICSMRARSKDT